MLPPSLCRRGGVLLGFVRCNTEVTWSSLKKKIKVWNDVCTRSLINHKGQWLSSILSLCVCIRDVLWLRKMGLVPGVHRHWAVGRSLWKEQQPNSNPLRAAQTAFCCCSRRINLPHFPRGSEWMRRLLDTIPVPPYPYKILLRKSSWETILGYLAAVTFGCPATMKFNNKWLNMVPFKACKSVESLEKPAPLVLLICRSRQWNNLLHFHPLSSLYLYWVMMGKRDALDVAYFPGVSKAFVFRPLYFCAPNLSGLFFFSPSCSWINFYSVCTTQSKHPPSKV